MKVYLANFYESGMYQWSVSGNLLIVANTKTEALGMILENETIMEYNILPNEIEIEEIDITKAGCQSIDYHESGV